MCYSAIQPRISYRTTTELFCTSLVFATSSPRFRPPLTCERRLLAHGSKGVISPPQAHDPTIRCLDKLKLIPKWQFMPRDQCRRQCFRSYWPVVVPVPCLLISCRVVAPRAAIKLTPSRAAELRSSSPRDQNCPIRRRLRHARYATQMA